MDITEMLKAALELRLGVTASDDVVDIRGPADTAATREGNIEELAASEGTRDEVD